MHANDASTQDASSQDGYQPDPTFSPEERRAVYRCIAARRDVRGQFLPTPVADDVLARLLRAAHAAPSVGFMQPWNFIVVRDPTVKRRVHAAFADANEAEARSFADADRAQRYRAMKLAGILDAPIGVCVTCDRSRGTTLGRTHQPEMDLYSAVCAVQNFWLAARAENVGVGWVSILRYDDLRAALGVPADIVPIAYLCVGHVAGFKDKPELESAGWLPRLPLRALVSVDGWNAQNDGDPLFDAL